MQDRLVDKRKFIQVSERALSELQESGAVDLCGERAGALVGCCIVVVGRSPRHEIEGDVLAFEDYAGGMHDMQLTAIATTENAKLWTLGDVIYLSKWYLNAHENDHVWAEIWEVVPNNDEYWTIYVVQAKDKYSGEWVNWSGMHASYFGACQDMSRYRSMVGVLFDSLRLMEFGRNGEVVSCWEVD